MKTATQKRASVHTLGCRLNQSETTLLEAQLKAEGYALVPFGDPADLAIVNTCTVTHAADAKSRKLVRRFISQNPDAYTAVIGCYAQMGAEALAAIDGVDLILGNQEKLNVLSYVKAGKNPTPLVVRDRIVRDDFTIEFADEAAPLDWRMNLKVQDGCDFMCAFCIIPFARGRSRSRALENILDEARNLLGRGACELVLTGVNIGTYQLDGRGIVEVVDALAELDGLERLRISSIEPTTIPDALFDRMADAAHPLVPYLHIPLQSGSDRVLQAMKRRYTRREFLDFIFEAHARVPDIGIGTDILVGFPGETDADFEDTCAALRDSPLFYAHVFKYSEREGTASARMADPIDPDTANERSAILRKISADKTRLFQQHHLGREVEVLFECRQDGFWTGYTPGFLRVAARDAGYLKNVTRTVRVESIRGDLVVGTIV
ncbi:MAG: tRNA (N(6)-L-threonylcarbamoyladenosine(37)-C(2))-methylthiotransferase MtaB [Candidatus Hydrogenedens sp.]|nr:tRNA (N(6)-L-threonylcarbamoyladenosine(37)-C(2))-methylthiotransferase MtaB [Candidatus Hydrogenedens sp.]